MLYPPLYRTACQLLGPDLKGISVSFIIFTYGKETATPFCHLLILFLKYIAYLHPYLLTYLLHGAQSFLRS